MPNGIPGLGKSFVKTTKCSVGVREAVKERLAGWNKTLQFLKGAFGK